MEKKILNDFCFHKPKTLDEALVLIDKYQENGLLMEGGSEVIPNMKSLVVTPDHIISLKHIPEFDYITYTPGEGLHIGPSCTLTKVEYDPNVQSVYPSLYMGVHGMSNTNIHNIACCTNAGRPSGGKERKDVRATFGSNQRRDQAAALPG